MYQFQCLSGKSSLHSQVYLLIRIGAFKYSISHKLSFLIFQVVGASLQMHARSLIIGVVFMVFPGLSTVWTEKCEHYSLSMPYKGRYCTGDGIVTPLVAPHLCWYQCILSSTCKAYNYNATVGICTGFSSPCPQALSDPAMEFSVFTQRPYEQCYEWIPYNSGDSIDERMIYADTFFHIIARMERSGNDIVSYFHTGFNVCYGYFGSPFSSRQCQRLRIMEDCTIFWVPYTAHDPIPPRAVMAGNMANGDIVYVTKFCFNFPPIICLPGHYVEGADNTFNQFDNVVRRFTTMMMMVVL